MAIDKIDVTKGITGVLPTANLGSGQGKTNFSKSNRNKMISKTILNFSLDQYD